MTGPKERHDTNKALNIYTFIFCLQEYWWSAIEKAALGISDWAHVEAQAVPSTGHRAPLQQLAQRMLCCVKQVV